MMTQMPVANADGTPVEEIHSTHHLQEENPEFVRKEAPAPAPVKSQPQAAEDPKLDKKLHAIQIRNAAIQKEVDEAMDPSRYETYLAESWDSDPYLKVFSARRQGISHIRKQIPCQDYCLTEAGNGYVLMAGSDGVSSCVRSDVGSRLACEAVAATARSAAKSCQTESQLVQRLSSVQFRKKVTRTWRASAFAHYQAHPDDVSRNTTEQLYLYGATLMYVLITENWYIAGNLGDGQILFFNEYDSMKLRLHPPKESSAVHCLVNYTSDLENFQTLCLSRSLFSGVLLSTDGIYSESFGQGQRFYEYAKEIKSRFLEAKEPFLPFCYRFEDGILRDLYTRGRTDDDCTVVLALDSRPCNEKSRLFRSRIDPVCDQALLNRMGAAAARYGMLRNHDYCETVVVPEEKLVTFLPELYDVDVEQPVSTWVSDGYSYGVYPDNDVLTIEYLYSSEQLMETGVRGPQWVLALYRKLRDCENQLKRQGLMFCEDAHFLVGVDEKTDRLVLRREALAPITEGTPKHLTLWSYFDALLGFLDCGNAQIPLFDVGFVTTGRYKRRVDGAKGGRLCRVQTEKGKCMLMNAGEDEWMLDNGTTIAPGTSVSLERGLRFNIESGQNGWPVRYSYVSKEEI